MDNIKSHTAQELKGDNLLEGVFSALSCGKDFSSGLPPSPSIREINVSAKWMRHFDSWSCKVTTNP